MMKAHVLTPWVQTTIDGETYNDPLINELLKDHQGWSWSDVTGQPAENLAPDPNLLAIELTCDEATLAAIEADPRFYVIWSE